MPVICHTQHRAQELRKLLGTADFQALRERQRWRTVLEIADGSSGTLQENNSATTQLATKTGFHACQVLRRLPQLPALASLTAWWENGINTAAVHSTHSCRPGQLSTGQPSTGGNMHLGSNAQQLQLPTTAVLMCLKEIRMCYLLTPYDTL